MTTPDQRTITNLVGGLVFPESPRWHEGRLWLSDMFAGRVLSIDGDGSVRVEAEFDGNVSGLGFLPDGSPLVVLMAQRRLMRLTADGPVLHADLADIPGTFLNDMVVSSTGRAYVDSVWRGEGKGSDKIVLVEPDGSARVAADESRHPLVKTPNGIALAEDERTLVFSSTLSSRVVAMSVTDDGTLENSRVFADTPDFAPDGLCLDTEGAAWLPGLTAEAFIRVREGGEVVDRVEVPGRLAVACVLGGDDRTTLFLVNAEGSYPVHKGSGSVGFVDRVTVEVPGSGTP